MRTQLIVGAVVLLAASCGTPVTGADGGAEVDSGVSAMDAGFNTDSGVTTDAGVDAGTSDAGVSDAGDVDAGVNDAGAGDAGAGDAGDADAGDVDAGQSDAGAADAGVADSGVVDAGVDAGMCMLASAPAQIIALDAGTRTLLRGTIVAPTMTFEGEVLVTGDTITCVAVNCGAADRIIETNGIVMPGLIDTHNHTLFDIFDATDWQPLMTYTNHNQWTNEARYGAVVDAKQYLNGEGSSPIDLGCEMNKYAELRALLSGTTSIVGVPNPANRGCYGTLARTIDQTPNGLPDDKIQVATLFPNGATADAICTNFQNGSTDAYLIHIAEGVDQTSLNEWTALNTVTNPDGCLRNPKTTIVNGTALGDPEFTIMATNQMSLVWSPKSNIGLYGGGTDLTKSADVPLALSKGVNVALGPDWAITGSQNLLDELRYAKTVDATVWGNLISSQTLTRMVTSNAARAIGLQNTLGSLAPGMKADIMVFDGDRCAPHDALLTARPANIKLVMVGGVVLTGDANLKPLGPSNPGCEDLTICTVNKFACVATTGGTATNKFAQTYVQIQTALSTNLTAYDAMNLSQWDFAPLAPLIDCTP